MTRIVEWHRSGTTRETLAYRRDVGMPPDAEPGPGTPPTSTVREELREVTRQRLLAAAESVFSRDGYSGATVGDIAAGANVSRATFYLHFPDKSAALIAVMRTNLADTPEYWRGVDAALVAGDRDALRASLSNTLHWYEQHADLLRPVREGLAANPALGRQTAGPFARFADDMTGYLDRVRPQERDRAHLRLQLLMIQLDQLAYRLIVLGQQDLDREAMLDELTDIWRLALPAAGRPS